MSAASEDVKHAEGPSHELHFDPDLEADGPKRVRARPMSTMSIQLTQEQFELLYLSPGGIQSKGDLSARLGNPTPIGIACFLIGLMALSMDLMGWAGASSGAIATQIGAFYFVGGGGAILAGIMEFIVGNTFASMFLICYGLFFVGFCWVLDPAKGVATLLGATSTDYCVGVAFFITAYAVLTLIMMVAALRTNVAFVFLFFMLEVILIILSANYYEMGRGNFTHAVQLNKAAGGLAFGAGMVGWYLLAAIMFLSVQMPIYLPMGDLSFLFAKQKAA